MKVALTGGTGFTGRRVLGELQSRGHDVTALVRAPLSGRTPVGTRVVEGDLSDSSALARLLEGQNALVHVASLGFGNAKSVVSALEASSVRRAVFFSSTAIHTRLPADSKAVRLEAEDLVRGTQLDWTLLRPTMIYGDPGDRNISRLFRFVATSRFVPLPGGGHALVQPVHVEDLGRAAADALACEASACRAYDLPGGEAAPLRALVQHVARLLERRVVLVPLPLRPMAVLAGLWRGLGLPPRLSSEQVLRLGEDKAFALDDARRDWGYAPRDLRTGLAQELQALRVSGFIG